MKSCGQTIPSGTVEIEDDLTKKRFELMIFSHSHVFKVACPFAFACPFQKYGPKNAQKDYEKDIVNGPIVYSL